MLTLFRLALYFLFLDWQLVKVFLSFHNPLSTNTFVLALYSSCMKGITYTRRPRYNLQLLADACWYWQSGIEQISVTILFLMATLYSDVDILRCWSVYNTIYIFIIIGIKDLPLHNVLLPSSVSTCAGLLSAELPEYEFTLLVNSESFDWKSSCLEVNCCCSWIRATKLMSPVPRRPWRSYRTCSTALVPDWGVSASYVASYVPGRSASWEISFIIYI